MDKKRLLELAAMLMAGDGAITLAAPRRHNLLWRFGPGGYRRALEALADRPAMTRAFAAAGIGAGLLLALRQYPDGLGRPAPGARAGNTVPRSSAGSPGAALLEPLEPQPPDEYPADDAGRHGE